MQEREFLLSFSRYCAGHFMRLREIVYRFLELYLFAVDFSKRDEQTGFGSARSGIAGNQQRLIEPGQRLIVEAERGRVEAEKFGGLPL